MKIETPLTAAKAYAGAKDILANTGHKIFTPSGNYFKLKPSLIAVRPSITKSVFFLGLKKDRVIISGMHLGHHDRTVLLEIQKTYGQFIALNERRFSRFRGDRWEDLIWAIAPNERDEFTVLTKNTRLAEAG